MELPQTSAGRWACGFRVPPNLLPPFDEFHLFLHQNLANPTALLLSGVMMLKHLGLSSQGDQIHRAVLKTIAEGRYLTGDLGGSSGTTDFTKAVIGNL